MGSTSVFGGTRFKADRLVVNVTDGSNGVAAHVYESWTLAGFSKGVFVATLTNTQLVLYGTVDDESVAQASADSRNLMMTHFGIANLSVTGELVFDTPVAYTRIRITTTPTNATNTAQVSVSKMV